MTVSNPLYDIVIIQRTQGGVKKKVVARLAVMKSDLTPFEVAGLLFVIEQAANSSLAFPARMHITDKSD
jgi:hypothetical protein